MSNRDRAIQQAEYVCYLGPRLDMRTGEFLFNTLRHEIAEKVRATDLDPFYEDLEFEEVVDWVDGHIVFDNEGKMVRLQDDHGVLWEEDHAA